MYFNVSITGSSYTQPTGVIDISIFDGSEPYLVEWRTPDLSPFPGTLIDNVTYPGSPQYTKAINVPIGLYYIDVINQYGLGEKQTECVIVSYSGYSQQNINNTPDFDVVTFPCKCSLEQPHCDEDCCWPNYFWLTTEDGCYISLGVNNCVDSCYLIGSSCYAVSGCTIITQEGDLGIADECGWAILLEDGNPPT